MNPADNGQKRSGGQVKHGLNMLKRTLYGLDMKQLDRRYRIGRALGEWRDSLIADLGGKGAVSTQQEALVDLCVRSKLMLDSIDNWLLQQRSLINLRKRALLPVVRERQQLADGLARYLGQLGLNRKAKDLPDLARYVTEKYATEEKPLTASETMEDGENK